MKIAELVSRTNVSKQLIHHYLREGLLKKPLKTGKNVAEYDETHLEQVLLIKDLRDKYFLPLPIIKKILKRQKKMDRSEKMLFDLQSQHLRPLDRFFPHDVDGREEYRAITRLSDYWLSRFEEWGIISPEIVDGEPVYSQIDVEIGRLIYSMDKLGFGPRNGYDPEGLARLAHKIRSAVEDTNRAFMIHNADKMRSEDFTTASVCYGEVMSMFVYALYKKIIREDALSFWENEGADMEPEV